MGRPSLATILGHETVRRDVQWSQDVHDRVQRGVEDTGLPEQALIGRAFDSLDAAGADAYILDLMRESESLRQQLVLNGQRMRQLARSRDRAQQTSRMMRTWARRQGGQIGQRFVKDLSTSQRPVGREPLYPQSNSPKRPRDRPPPLDTGPPGGGDMQV